ncbi:hypothetical protein A6U92_18165 [Agrobacterium rubi]|nr:hypothetical protein A6U92_18165 [Agrobacterium rubi]
MPLEAKGLQTEWDVMMMGEGGSVEFRTGSGGVPFVVNPTLHRGTLDKRITLKLVPHAFRKITKGLFQNKTARGRLSRAALNYAVTGW